MKKLFTFLIGFVLLSFSGTNVYSQTTVYDLKEEFATDVSSWDFSLNNGGTQTISYNTTNKLLQIRWPNSSSEYIKTLSTAITPGTDNKVTVDLIIKAYTCGSSSNFGALYFLDESGNAITGFYLRRQNIGGGNKWAIGRATSYVGTTYSYPTSTDGLSADQPTARLVFTLDFSAKTLSFTAQQGTFDYITRVFSASGSTVSSTDQAFINTSATNVKSLKSWYYRGGSTTGTNGFDLMYAGISALRLVATASVTVNYKDSEGNILKTSRVQPDLVVGSTYNATIDDKATFSDVNYFYSYNAIASTDNVVVAEGAVINLIFKKTPLTPGNYVWTGITNSNWNNGDENFTADNGVTNIGYQDNNPIWFPAVIASGNKNINLNANLTVGANDIILAGNNYDLSGTGSISGTGKFILNLTSGETVTMGIRNNMVGVDIKGGDAILTNDMGGATYNLVDGAKITLQTGAEFNKAITGTGTVTIQTNSNVFYNNTLAGPSTVNLILGVSGSVSGSNWTSKVLTEMPSGAQVNVTTNQTTVGYGVATNSVQNSKLNLGDNVRMLFNYNPNEGGTTIISIGELSGSASASIEGGWVNSGTRGLNYNIGGLGTDATFYGVFKNYSTAPTAPLNIHKKGAGIWTLTGTSPDFILGTLKVDEGTVILNGSLTGTAVPVTVASGATLKGTGTIAGATTVNGTLEGNLNFGSTLALNGIAKFVVNGVNADEFDAIDVVGAVNLGGSVEITVNIASGVKGVDKIRNANPPVGTRIKLINAGSIETLLPTVHYPSSGWTFLPASGELVYDPANLISGLVNNGIEFRIYPTLTRDNLNVEGNVSAIEVINLAGQKVKQVQANGTKTVVSMNNLSAGAYFVKALMEDGSVNVQNVILQK